MTAFLVGTILRVFVPVLFAAALFRFLSHLAIPGIFALVPSVWMAGKLMQQGHRNARRYMDDYRDGLAEQSPLAFVLNFSLPFFLSVGFAFAADWVDWHYGFFIPSLTGLGVGGLVFFLAFQAIRIDYGPLRFLFLRGRQVLTFREAIRKARQNGYDTGFLFGGLSIPERIANNHFLVAGASGSGKSITIRLLLKGISQYMKQQTNVHAVVYDPKSNALPLLSGLSGGDLPVVDLHPFREGCFGWDIAADVKSQRDVESVANILIPREAESGENRFFADAPRELLQAVMRALMIVAPDNWTLRDVYLILTSQQHLKEMLTKTPEGQALLPDYFGGDPRTLSNVRLSIRTRTLRYRTVAAAFHHAAESGRTVSLNRWATSGTGYLVLGADKTEDSGIDAFNRIVIHLLGRCWLHGPDSPRTPQHFLVLDEVQSAGRIDALAQLLNEGREKGVSAILGFQDVSSIRKVYGNDVAESLLAQCGNKALLRMEGDTTSQWASRIVGEVEQYEYTYNQSTTSGTSDGKSTYSTSETRNESLARRAALMPADFLTIPPTNIQNGLTGYYSSPEIGVWQHAYRSDELWESNTAAPGDDFRPETDWPLKPFDDGDMERLSLSSVDPAIPDVPTAEAPIDKPAKWDRVKNNWLDE